MAVYPNAIPTSTNVPDIGLYLGTGPHATIHNDLRDEVLAALTELGVTPAGAWATVKARLDAGWQPIAAANVAAAATFTVTIPASTYKMVRVYIRGLNSDPAPQAFQCRVNNDTTAGLHEYMYTRVLANATVSGDTAVVSATRWNIGTISNVTASIFDMLLFETDSSSLVPFQCVNTVFDPQLVDARTNITGGRLTANRLTTSLVFSSLVGNFTGNYVAEGYRV